MPTDPGVQLNDPIRILFLAAEADPFIKVGGLGDVAGSLPRAILDRKSPEIPIRADIRLVIPFHGSIDRSLFSFDERIAFSLPVSSGMTGVEVYCTLSDGLPVYFIAGDLISPDGPVYSNDVKADTEKFTFFSLAALEMARRLDWAPHILHANDWHTSPAIYALPIWQRRDDFFNRTASLLGVHNLPYMGSGAARAFRKFGLAPVFDRKLPEWAQDVPLALALAVADSIVTVSPSYAREILTAEFGCGLQRFLRSRKQSITGILNGLDVKRWNPQTDPEIKQNYDVRDIASRAINKQALQQEIGLEQNHELFLIGMVSRLDWQKGIDLVPEMVDLLVNSRMSRIFQLVILGTGDKRLEKRLIHLATSFPNQVKTILRFDAPFSHRIFAGADLFLIPSRYEPCGLTQMIAMRYGCVPLGREVGGLKDTILDHRQKGDSTGFTFEKPTPQALFRSVQRAYRVYSQNPEAWKELQQRGMNRDFSWRHSARQYLTLYQQLATHRNDQRSLERMRSDDT